MHEVITLKTHLNRQISVYFRPVSETTVAAGLSHHDSNQLSVLLPRFWSFSSKHAFFRFLQFIEGCRCGFLLLLCFRRMEPGGRWHLKRLSMHHKWMQSDKVNDNWAVCLFSREQYSNNQKLLSRFHLFIYSFLDLVVQISISPAW